MTPLQLQHLRDQVPPIPPVDRPDAPRPFWSVLIPAYGRADMLANTIGSVLAQDRGPDAMDISVLDDGTPGDAIGDVVRRVGAGRVGYVRRDRNLGQFANVNAGIAAARGFWIHVLHDDDWVEDGFYARLEEHLSIDGPAGAALTALRVTSGDGKVLNDRRLLRETPGPLSDVLARFATSAGVQTPTVVVRRAVYETLGGFCPAFAFAGDWEMWQRIASHYDWWYEPRACACYREHGDTISGTAKRDGTNIADMRAVIAFAQTYLPAEHAAMLRDRALSYWAVFAARLARRMILRGDYQGAATQIIEALRTEPSERMVNAIVSMEQHLGRKPAATTPNK